MDAALDPTTCYPALVARDARFDGRFFVGVTSTGIYCRPICRVRTPRAANCRFFANAAQAEAAAFRPCLKCRPELAPGHRWSAMDATQMLARQAAALIDAGGAPSMTALAARLGITDRHLRRIFLKVHGVTPLQYEQTRRLLLAKQLLCDSDRPMVEVAAAAGFGSLRRFNAAFVEHYRLQPGALRRGAADGAADGEGEGETHVKGVPGVRGEKASRSPALRLAYRPPYDVGGLLAFLQARAVPGVEAIDLQARRVARTFGAGWLVADFATPGLVRVQLAPALWPHVGVLLPRLRDWLDLDAEPAAIAAVLGPSAEPGLRLPGALDRFELALRAVLGQQVTVAAARTLVTRLVARFGAPLDATAAAPAGLTHFFPTPQRLAAVVDVGEIAELGIIRRRAELIIELAKRWPTLRFAQGGGDAQAALVELESLSGLGAWTAQYMLMRGWSWPDAWPPGDIVLRRVLSPDRSQPLTPRACNAAAEAFRPYRSYAVLHFWRTA